MKLYYTIGEVARMLQVPPSTLRYWEKEFSSLKPKNIRNGERRYTNSDIDLLKQIHSLLKKEGYTIEGAKKMLNKEIGETADSIEKIQSKLQNLKNELINLKSKLKA